MVFRNTQDTLFFKKELTYRIFQQQIQLKKFICLRKFSFHHFFTKLLSLLFLFLSSFAIFLIILIFLYFFPNEKLQYYLLNHFNFPLELFIYFSTTPPKAYIFTRWWERNRLIRVSRGLQLMTKQDEKVFEIKKKDSPEFARVLSICRLSCEYIWKICT